MNNIIMSDKDQNFTHPQKRGYVTKKVNAITRMLDSNTSLLKVLDKINVVVDDIMSRQFKNSTCTKGCSHCCHIAVGMTNVEAEYIESRTGHKAKNLTDRKDIDLKVRTPCTFLKNNECSIYEHRPVACRAFLSFDSPKNCEDESNKHLLTSLQPMGQGGSEAINYIYTMFTLASHQKRGKSFVIGDLRDFF